MGDPFQVLLNSERLAALTRRDEDFLLVITYGRYRCLPSS
jgi:alpha-D-ribose 1-methylphosphonate 5-triphosphate synthase subunit PhnI